MSGDGGDVREACAAAEAALEDGDPHEALGALRVAFGYPARGLTPSQWTRGLGVFGRVAEEVGDEELARRARAYAADPRDVDAGWQLAYQLYEVKLFDLAAAVLDELRELTDDAAPIVNELVANLEALGRNNAAYEVLDNAQVAVATDPMARYLLSFHCLMTGRLDEARERMESLADLPLDHGDVLVENLAAMLRRADALAGCCALDEHDLRGWHLVLNGGLLLHTSPFGYGRAMRGRYAMIQDSLSRCAYGIERLRIALEAGELEIDRVITLPDRGSAILGRGAALRLGLPCVPWSEAQAPGLVVAYDMDEVGVASVLEALHGYAPGQRLWAHAGSWTDPFPYTPDLQTYLYQHNVDPWSGGAFRIDAETGEPSSSDPDERPVEAIAEELAAAEVEVFEPEDGWSEEDDALRELVARLKGDPDFGIAAREGQRPRQRVGSPVPSNRFR